MLFTSDVFLIFFIGVFVAQYFANRAGKSCRNLTVLASSYLFYGWWDWMFLFLIVFSSAVDYAIGLSLRKHSDKRTRNLLLGTSLTANLGLLFTFKYFDFFSATFYDCLAALGIHPSPLFLHWILPVGISFYTFQTLSYTIDVWRRRMKPTNDLLAFFAYVAFFPQLVAGPIERAERLLPQFQRTIIVFDRAAAIDGLRLILWGLFLKAVVADNLAFHVNEIFGNTETKSGSVLALGAIYFGFQIYGDFAGYSFMARGLALLLGYDLMVNFRVPYFSRDIAEFWRRWHISLSTWFRDYVYIPIGGNRSGRWNSLRNVLIVFVLSGLWHGAEWTFVVWGALHGLAFAPLFLLGHHRRNLGEIAPGRILPVLRDLPGMAWTFTLVTIGWIFFRAENLGQALEYLGGLFDASLFSVPSDQRGGLVWIFVLVVLDWIHRNDDVPIRWPTLARPLRWIGYLALSSLIYYRGYFGDQEFIYFQF